MVGALDLKYRSKVKTLQTSAGKNAHLGIVERIPAPPAPTRAKPIGEIDVFTAARFWMKVQIGTEDECWNWKAGSSGFGYGRFKIGGKLFSPHRIAYAIAKGSIPTGEGYHGSVIMHACDNPGCCNPAHLSLGTQRDNAKDMAAKGRNFMPNARGAVAICGAKLVVKRI